LIYPPTYLSPRLPIGKLPQTEHDHARFIDTLLHDLGRRRADFEAALHLFESCTTFLENANNRILNEEEYRLRWHWRSFAIREAVATIYRVDEDLDCANKNLNKCQVLVTLVDHDLKRAARRAFKTSFPGVDGIRHGIQHFAKLYGTPEAFAQHAASEINYVNHLEGRTVRTVYEGKDAFLELSEESLSKLTEVRDLYWGAYFAAGAQ
jgi:hypothetical protein